MQLEQISAMIHDNVHHEIDHALKSPQVVNRLIGEAMRHIGVHLTNTGMGYLPVERSEILVEPIAVGENGKEAVILCNRELGGRNTFSIIARSGAKEGDAFTIDVIAFSPDPVNYTNTRFLKFPEHLEAEIVRQLGLIMKESSIVQKQVLITEYAYLFPPTDKDPVDPAPQPVEEPAPVAVEETSAQPVSKLPPVINTDELM